MLDKTNAGVAGADEAVSNLMPSSRTPRRRSNVSSHARALPTLCADDTKLDRAIAVPKPRDSSPDPATNSELGGAHLVYAAHASRSPADDAAARGGDGAHSQPVHHVLRSPIVTAVGSIQSDDGAHFECASQLRGSPIIAEIQQLWRMRQSWHRAEKSLTLQGKAKCRAWTEGDKDAAGKLFDKAQAGEPVDAAIQMVLMPFLAAIEQFEPQRKAVEKRLKVLSQSLPAWPWVKAVHGFGPLNLAAVVGEAGDVGSYRNPSCLWKRMGLAVIDGGRQRKIADADAALLHGYNPSRRAVAYLLSDTLVKGKSSYRQIYLDRKAYELAREDEGKPKSLMHAHKRAQRYMVKRLLKDFWQAWRRTTDPLSAGTTLKMSAADLSSAA